MKRHEPFDKDGKLINIGDCVRIVGVPDLSGMSPDCVSESSPVFRYLVGKYKRVVGFDEHGLVEISFTMGRGTERCRHSVWIEPRLLEVPAIAASRPGQP